MSGHLFNMVFMYKVIYSVQNYIEKSKKFVLENF